jgi:hypothetical protein
MDIYIIHELSIVKFIYEKNTISSIGKKLKYFGALAEGRDWSLRGNRLADER